MRVSLWKVGYIEYSVCLQHLTCARWRAAAVAATHKLIANSESEAELKMQGKCVWVSWMCVMLMWNLSSAATGHCQMRDWQSILFALSRELNFVTIYSWGDRDTRQELMWRNFNGFVCSLSFGCFGMSGGLKSKWHVVKSKSFLYEVSRIKSTNGIMYVKPEDTCW